MLLAALYFPVSDCRPALHVSSPAAISLLLTFLVTTAGPLVGPARPCVLPSTFISNKLTTPASSPATLHYIRCPMCGQFTSNGHMASNSSSKSGLRQDHCNSALQILISVLERHNGGRWDTISADFGSKPINYLTPPLSTQGPRLTVTHPRYRLICPPAW
jgi:hypothetical protein